jgi:modulator of FtsH protease HflK
MAWNEPGNSNEKPWGKKKPASSSGGLEDTLKQWQQRLESLLGARAPGTPEPSAGGTSGAGGLSVWVLVVVLIAIWLFTGMFQVNASDRGVIQRFGRFTEVRGEGWGWAFPWPVETVTKVNVSRVNSVEYQSRMLTADVNLVEIRSAIQYQYADPVKVLFQVRDLEPTLREVSESAIREVVGQASLNDVLGVGRQAITQNTRELIQRTLDSYNSGVRVTSVNLTNVQVPEAVVAAQRDANKAIEDRERYSKEAQAYAFDILPKVKGTAQRQIQDAEAYKSQVVALADGDVARFNSIYAAYAQAPEVTRQRMYIETIEQLMQQSKKIILDSKSGAGGNMIYLPLDKLLEQRGASVRPVPSATPAEASSAELPTVTIDGRGRAVR